MENNSINELKKTELTQEELNYIQSQEFINLIPENVLKEININNSKLVIDIEKSRSEKFSLSIYLVSLIGGLLSVSTVNSFIYLLFEGVLKESISFFSGILFYIIAVIVNKLANTVVGENFSFSFYINSIFLIIFGLAMNQYNIVISSLFMIFLSIISIALMKNKLVIFISTIIIWLSLITIHYEYFKFNNIEFFSILLSIGLYLIFNNEAKLRTLMKSENQIYSPFLFATVIIYMSISLILSSEKQLDNLLISSYLKLGVVSFTNIFMIVYLAKYILTFLDFTNIKNQIIVLFSIFTILSLTFISPGISASLLLLLLSYKNNNSEILILSIIGLLYSISIFYYNLDFTLLVKSYLMLSTGILFLIFYFLTYKKMNTSELETNEKL